MKVVILAGGRGLRYCGSIPKPLAPIGGFPIIYHVMKIYAAQGYKDFVILTGYKAQLIEKRVRRMIMTNFWNVEFVYSGGDTETGGRILYAKDYVGDNFFLTYADGLGDVDLQKLVETHVLSRRIATVTAVNPVFQYGVFKLGSETVGRGKIKKRIFYARDFVEKPVMKNVWINAGFMAFSKRIFKYIKSDGDRLEVEVFGRLVKRNQIAVYKHNGFWMSMDTYKDNLKLNDLWNKGEAGWKIW